MKQLKKLLLLISILIVPLLMIGVAPQSYAAYSLPTSSYTWEPGSSSISVNATWALTSGEVDVFVFTTAQSMWWNNNGKPDDAPSVKTILGSTGGSFCQSISASESYEVVFSNWHGSVTANFPDYPTVVYSSTDSCPGIPAFGLIISFFSLLAAIGLLLRKSLKMNFQ